MRVYWDALLARQSVKRKNRPMQTHTHTGLDRTVLERSVPFRKFEHLHQLRRTHRETTKRNGQARFHLFTILHSIIHEGFWTNRTVIHQSPLFTGKHYLSP